MPSDFVYLASAVAERPSLKVRLAVLRAGFCTSSIEMNHCGVSAKYHRILAPPAMRISMLVILRKQETPFSRRNSTIFGLAFKYVLARKMFDIGGKTSGVIDRAVDLKAISFANVKIVGSVAREPCERSRCRTFRRPYSQNARRARPRRRPRPA